MTVAIPANWIILFNNSLTIPAPTNGIDEPRLLAKLLIFKLSGVAGRIAAIKSIM